MTREVRAERFAGALEKRFRRLDRQVQASRDLGDREAVGVLPRQRLRVARRELVHRLVHQARDLAAQGAPLGVVGFVFEGRPNVFADACGVLRGGNTVVFEPRWLRLPHPQARLGELRLRRADTVWAQAAVSLHGCRLGQLPWPLRHLRDQRGFNEQAATRWCERLLADLGGVGLYRGIERWRTRAPWRRVGELSHARGPEAEDET